MKPTDEIARQCEEAVVKRNPELLNKAFDEAEGAGIPIDAMLAPLTAGLDALRLKLKNHTTSIPEFLLSVDVMKEGLNRIKTARGNAQHPDAVRIVIGVVEGDVHDLGKNIVAGVMAACGYEVIDLGKDISADRFIAEVKRADAAVLALSTMMSTPLENMRETIARCKGELPEVRTIVGGATLDERIARSFGADGYAESAVTVPEELLRILGRSG